MNDKKNESSPAKRNSRISPVIKADGARIGSDEKVEVQSFQLGERREVGTEVMEALKGSHEKLMANLEARFSLFLRAEVTVSLEDFTAAKYYKISKELDLDQHVNLFQAERVSGAGFVGLEPKVALTAVNLLLGGKGEAPKESRQLTKIESDLSADLVNELLSEWKMLWQETLDFEPKVYQQEHSVKNFSQCDPHTGVFLARLKIKIRDVEGSGCLLFPTHMIEPVMRRIQNESHVPKEKPRNLTAQWSPVYEDVSVAPDVRVPVGHITVKEFLALQPGSVVTLREQAMDHACLHLAGQSLFAGSFGVSANRLALSLKHKL